MALVLQRKAGESVVMETPDGVRITVTLGRVNRQGETHLIFDAPRDVIIHREEVWERNQAKGEPPTPTT